MSRPREVFLPSQFPGGNGPPVSRVRSTLLSASLQGLRMMGWEKRYYDALPPALHHEIRALIAGVWLPVDLAVAHYTACDRMELSTDEIKEMGKAVSMRTQKTFVGTLGSVAAGGLDVPETLMQDQAMQKLEGLLRELPARQREAFMLRNFEGLDVGETAKAMGCSEGSVKTHYSRAVHSLRDRLGEVW